MTDANSSGANLHVKCAIHEKIQQKDLLSLLGVVVESLRVGDAVTDPETQVPKIYPDWLSREFVRERSVDGITPNGFYVHPLVKKRSDVENLQKNILTLKDVTDLFKSLPEYIDDKIKKKEYSDVEVLNPEQNELLDRLKADQSGELLRIDLNFLRGDSQVILSIIATLGENVRSGEKAPEVDITLPDQYKSLISGELNLAVSWEWVKPLVNDVVRAQLNTRVIFFDFDGTQRGVDVKEIRFFLNTWLKKLYDEYSQKFREKGTPLPDSRLFDATNKLPLYFDLDIWVELDADVAKFIAGELAKVIDEFLKTKTASGGIPGLQKDTKEDEEKEQVTANINKVEQVDELIKRFEDAGKSYRDETNRLTTILLPQFFAMHGIRREITELSSIDGANFGLVEREFRSELENVLRSLTPAELQLLSTKGASLEFRLIVLRKLYGKLSTNPRFIGSLTQYKENYISEIERRISTGEPLQNELKEINRQSNLPDDDFNRDLANKERSKRDDWIKDSSGQTNGVAELKEFSGLHNITQRDLKLLIARLAKDGSVDYDTLLRNLDVIIAERWSPEQLRHLSQGEAQAVFGMILPDSLRANSTTYNLFLQICAEYLYARRQHLADNYHLDQISRDNGRATDLASLAAAQTLAERYKDYGGGEAVIVARASDTTTVNSYRSDIAVGVKAIHAETKEQRKESIDSRQKSLSDQYNATTTIEGKRKLLASLGVLTLDIDDVQNDETAQIALLQSLFEEAMQADYNDQIVALDEISFYEDEDGGYVQEGGLEEEPTQRRAVPNRYGQPGARSLMKGALNLRNKFKAAKKRIKQAKRVLNPVKKSLEEFEKAALTPFLGPLAQNKYTRRGSVVALAAMVLDTINIMQHSFTGMIGGLVGMGTGGLITGASGVLLTGGPWGALFAVPGGIVGAWTGAHAGAAMFGQTVPTLSLGSSSVAAGSGVGSGAAALNKGAAKVALTGAEGQTGGLGSGASTALASGGYVVGTIVVATATIAGALQVPAIQTLNSSGLESRYVSIRKTTTGENSYPTAVPGQITYQIYLSAKDTYQIDLQNFQDTFTIKVNTDKNTGTPAELSCDSQLNMDTARTKQFTAADGEVLLGECTVPLNESYHDSSILNEITIQFAVSENGVPVSNEKPNLNCGENDTTFCAMTSLNICLGECPAAKQGCWPTTGNVTQPPYGGFSHSVVDAYDIGAPLGTPVYATFEGEAYAFDTNDPEATNQGLIFRSRDGSISRIYGKHVLLVANEGFVLLYGHMSEHGEKMVLGDKTHVVPGDVVGYVGNSGSTLAFPMGNHLHYEYRVPSGGTWKTVIPGAPQDPLTNIVPGDAPGERFVYVKGKSVTTCYP